MPRLRPTPGLRKRRPLPSAALLALAVPLAVATGWITWPETALVSCANLPVLAVFAVCAAVLFILSVRGAATAARLTPGALPASSPTHVWAAACAAVLSLLAFFLAVHYLAVYHAPCFAVQHHLRPQ